MRFLICVDVIYVIALETVFVLLIGTAADADAIITAAAIITPDVAAVPLPIITTPVTAAPPITGVIVTAEMAAAAALLPTITARPISPATESVSGMETMLVTGMVSSQQ